MNDVKVVLKEHGVWDTFEKLPPSHKKEYMKWIDETKKPETRAKRIQKMAEMLKTEKKVQ